MQIKIEIKRLAELQKAFLTSPGTVKRELRLALRVSLRNIQRRARSEHRFKSRTGDAERSVKTEILSEWPLVGRVVLDPAVTMTEGGGSYAYFIHEGTKAHSIAPRFKRALRWPTAGGSDFVFSMRARHPGTKPDPFVENAGEKERENINQIFDRYVERALKEAGIM